MVTSDLLSVLSSLESKGSGWGISYYTTRCARKARLDKELGSGTSSYEAKVGTCFHKLSELYFTNQLSDIALPLSDDPEECKVDPVQEALRVFAVYVKCFPKNEFTTFAAEYELPQNKLIEEAVGVTPFTGRIDRVVHLSDQQAVAVNMRRGLELEPGWYLVDIKTTGKKDANAQFAYALSLQFQAYQLAWNVLNPGMEVKGLIVDNVIRHSDLTKKEDGALRSFRSFFIPPPSATQTQALRQYLKWKGEYLKTDHCELTACTDWGGCSHYMNGNCIRI